MAHEEELQRLRTAWRYASAEVQAAFGWEIAKEVWSVRREGEAHMLLVEGMVGGQTGEPMVGLRWRQQTGLMSPEEARGLAMNLLEAAAGADADAYFVSFMRERVGFTEPEAIGQMLVEFRAWRQRRAELPEDPEGITG